MDKPITISTIISLVSLAFTIFWNVYQNRKRNRETDYEKYQAVKFSARLSSDGTRVIFHNNGLIGVCNVCAEGRSERLFLPQSTIFVGPDNDCDLELAADFNPSISPDRIDLAWHEQKGRKPEWHHNSIPIIAGFWKGAALGK